MTISAHLIPLLLVNPSLEKANLAQREQTHVSVPSGHSHTPQLLVPTQQDHTRLVHSMYCDHGDAPPIARHVLPHAENWRGLFEFLCLYTHSYATQISLPLTPNPLLSLAVALSPSPPSLPPSLFLSLFLVSPSLILLTLPLPLSLPLPPSHNPHHMFLSPDPICSRFPVAIVTLPRLDSYSSPLPGLAHLPLLPSPPPPLPPHGLV